MKKIRYIFIGLVFVICVFALVFFTFLRVPFETEIEKISEFKITRISGNGSIYYAKNPITPLTMSQAKVVDIKEMYHTDDIYLKADAHTSFEFYCFGTAFTVLPGSQMYYQPKTKEISFYSGEYYWKKEVKNKNIEISLLPEIEKKDETQNTPQMILSISESGRIKITGSIIEAWNYAGNLKFNSDNQEHGLKANQMLLANVEKVEVFDILQAPEFISPENKVITIKKPADLLVKFSWRAVKGAKDYFLRIFSSPLKENVLDEVLLSTTRKTVNIQQIEGNEFYWQIFPFDRENNREGVPSKIGYLKLIGSSEDMEISVLPPKLTISSLTVSGNMVLIRGEAEKGCRLFINQKMIPLNMDGTFYETILYKKIGTKTITFRLVAPTELETNITRTVSIFDE